MEIQGWIYVALGMLLSLVIFLICREIVCWYFKMNEVTSLLKEIRESLQKSVFNKNSEH